MNLLSNAVKYTNKGSITLSVEAKIFGDSPFREMCSMDEETQLKELNFTIFSYLTHRKFLFNNEYYNFRLDCIGDEKQIYLGNMRRMLEEIRSNKNDTNYI